MAMSLPHLVLGLLDQQPRSGYDLKKVFDETAGHYWNADRSQIYRTLARLEQEGFVEATEVPQEGKPDRKNYRITAAGGEHLSAWLHSPIEDGNFRKPFAARLFFLGREDDPELVRRLVARRREEVEERLRTLETAPAPSGSFDERLRTATLRGAIHHMRAELLWLVEIEEIL